MKPYSKEQSTISAKTYREVYLKNYCKKNKYNAKTIFYNGRKYDSRLEANFAEELDWRIDAGEIKEVIPQHKIELRGLFGERVCNYFIDFKVINADDSITYYEVKGMKTQLWILKWKLTVQQIAIDEPGSELVIIR